MGRRGGRLDDVVSGTRRVSARAVIRAGSRTVAAGFVAALLGCATMSYADGAAMVENAIAAFAESLDPPPPLPSPRDGGYPGTCDGLDGDSEGRTVITNHYNLGVTPIATSDAWFDQARRYFETHGFGGVRSDGVAGDDLTMRTISGRHRSSRVGLLLRRILKHEGVPHSGTTEIVGWSPCIREPLSSPS